MKGFAHQGAFGSYGTMKKLVIMRSLTSAGRLFCLAENAAGRECLVAFDAEAEEAEEGEEVAAAEAY